MEINVTVTHKFSGAFESFLQKILQIEDIVTGNDGSDESEETETEESSEPGGLNLPGEQKAKKMRRTKAEIAKENVEKAMKQAEQKQSEAKAEEKPAGEQQPNATNFAFDLPGQTPVSQTPAAPKASLSDLFAVPVTEAPKVTHIQAKTLAAQKMQESNGAKELAITSLIEAAGATSISTIEESKLSDFYQKLSAI